MNELDNYTLYYISYELFDDYMHHSILFVMLILH